MHGNAVRQCQVAARVDPVQTGTDHGNGGRRGAAPLDAVFLLQRAFVGCGINAQRQARDDAQAGAAQRLGKLVGVLRALRARVAAADHRQAGALGKGCAARLQKARCAQHIQHQRRVFGFQQQARVAWVAQHQDGPHHIGFGIGANGSFASFRGGCRLWLQPLAGALQRLCKTLWFAQQGPGLGGGCMRLQRSTGLQKNPGRQPIGVQQAPRCGVAHARRQHQAQPGLQVVQLRFNG